MEAYSDGIKYADNTILSKILTNISNGMSEYSQYTGQNKENMKAIKDNKHREMLHYSYFYSYELPIRTGMMKYITYFKYIWNLPRHGWQV